MRFRGLTTSSYTVYDYATSRHTDLWSKCALYVQYIYIYIQYTYIYIKYMYLFPVQ